MTSSIAPEPPLAGLPAGRLRDVPVDREAAASGVSWGAIFAGAAGAAALSMILLVLGVGLGLAVVSPWSRQGTSATALGVSAIVWLAFTQLAASGIGGYLAGRLRTRWADVPGDEVYFRDTGHGFLAWAVATLLTAATLTTSIGSVVSGGAQVGAAAAGGAAVAATAGAAGVAGGGMGSPAGRAVNADNSAYFIDALFRRDAAAPGAAAPAADGSAIAGPSAGNPAAALRASAEVARIMANGLAVGKLAPEDSKYVAQVVAQQAGIPQAEAERRVTDTFGRMQAKAQAVEEAARDAADKARKASSYTALWLFVSLLAGAFFASLMATFGGRQRDAL